MYPERWKEIEALYDALASVEPVRRESFLHRVREANPELCGEVESLLSAGEQADYILPEAPSVRRLLESRRWQAGPAMFRAGDLIGERFRIVRLIGAGGMGEVYEAEDLALKESVALKTIRPGIVDREEMLSRFAHEVLAAKRISHPNICRIHDLHRHRPPNSSGTEIVFLTMELLQGRTLSQTLREDGPLSLAEAEPLVEQIAGALTAAHSAGVAHRDLKPENIILTTAPGVRGRAVVVDFGLARTAENSGLTSPGHIIGTPAYMAPEQLFGGEVTAAADIYAFGIVVHQMVTGRFPFQGDSPVAGVDEWLQRAPAPPATCLSSLPAEWERAISGCLEREPGRRFQSASEVWETITGRSYQARSENAGLNYRRLFRMRGLPFIAAALVVGLASGVLTQSHVTNSRSGMAPVYLAVMPFQPLGNEPRLGYQAEGITEALATRLTLSREIHLASRSAVDSAKTVDPLKISRALGVRFLLTGSVQKETSAKIAVTARLQEGETGHELWAGRFSGTSQDLLTMEERICSDLMQALHLPRTRDESGREAAQPTDNPEAYDLYLQGRAAFRQKSDVASGLAAVALFTRAFEKDPHFGLAYAGMADACMYIYDQKKDRLWLDKAAWAAEKAIRDSPGLADPHVALGGVYRQMGRYAEAIRELERALALAPGSDAAARRLASVYKDKEDEAESMRYYAAAIDANPYYWRNHSELGRAQVHFARYQPAIESFVKVTELAPDIATGYLDLGAAYFHQGKCRQAVLQFQKASQITPNMFAYANLSAGYSCLGRFDEAIQAGELAVKLGPDVEWALGNLADAYRWSGRREKANATYRRAIMLTYRELETNPRDAALLGRMALYYEKEGNNEKSLQLITQARKLDATRVELLFDQCVIESLAGYQKNALSHLRQAVEKGYDFAQLEHERDLRSLLSTPGYEAFKRAVSVSAMH